MNSFICWIGGKKLLRNDIIKNFPNHMERYIEVFGGAGWVLFGKEPHKLEVFNDIDSELINLYRCIKYHSEALQKELEFMLVSRKQFYDARESSLNNMTDIQRAARYFYLIKVSFGGDKSSFGTNRKNLINAVEYLSIVNERLKNVVIENRDFADLIKVYDRPKALFYSDPPYFKAEKYYAVQFDIDQHKKLREVLGNIKGKFILTYNDCDYVRQMYKDFNIIEIERNHNLVAKKGGARYKELIIKNFKITRIDILYRNRFKYIKVGYNTYRGIFI